MKLGSNLGKLMGDEGSGNKVLVRSKILSSILLLLLFTIRLLIHSRHYAYTMGN
jgi:hypothetical protein